MNVVLPLLLALAQEPAVDGKRVDAAIARGVAWLKTAPSTRYEESFPNSDELILWTFVHAGVRESDPVFQKYFKNVQDAPLERTYKVALLAMTLEEMDRVRHQKRIFACAQFLVDNQCRNGQWTYGQPTTIPEVNIPEEKKPVATPVRSGVREFGSPETKVKPPIVNKILVKKQNDGGDSGDNSNTQYAALGLRACHEAGIVIPYDVILLAIKWLKESQHPGKGGTGAAKGWDYGAAERGDPYLSMTAGAVGGLAIYLDILKKDWKKDPGLKAGVEWLGKHFHAGVPEKSEGDWFAYYALYGLERAGMLYGTDKFGDHDWYAEGAAALLAAQQPDGSWASGDKDRATWNTCFAILFLKRATRPLVASVDDVRKK